MKLLLSLIGLIWGWFIAFEVLNLAQVLLNAKSDLALLAGYLVYLIGLSLVIATPILVGRWLIRPATSKGKQE